MPKGKRVSAEILKLKGDDKVHTVKWRNQDRDKEILASQKRGPCDPEPPAHFTASEGALYREVLDRAHIGVLSYADKALVEMTALLWHQMRTEGVGDDKAMSKLLSCLDKLGMTPVSRGKIAMLYKDDGKEDNPIKEFGT